MNNYTATEIMEAKRMVEQWNSLPTDVKELQVMLKSARDKLMEIYIRKPIVFCHLCSKKIKIESRPNQQGESDE